jgi:hypothetical protein
MPRSEIPWVVGFATTLDERRNKENPGTLRKRSSRLTPGICRIVRSSSTVINAGVSVEIFSVTVMLVFSGSIFIVSVWGAAAAGEGSLCPSSRQGSVIGTQQTNVALAKIPTVRLKASRGAAEDDLEHISIMGNGQSFTANRSYQS